PTPAQVLGDAIHRAVLQPGLFGREFVCGPDGDRRKKVVREAWDELQKAYPGATVLAPSDFSCCIEVRDAVWAHPAARRILQGAEAELSAVWEDTAPGHKPFLSKGRFDIVNSRLRILADLKTTEDASPG